jgi:hypothetical protein
MLEVAVRLILAGVLAVGVVGKLASPRTTRAAMATFGFGGTVGQWVAWSTALAAELALAGGVAAGSDTAAYAAAGLMLLFAATLGSALLAGKAGAPCACFGARSTVSGLSIARNLGLAAAFAALPALPSRSLSTDEWLTLGLLVALLVCVALTVAVLALAREVGMLRLRLGPAAALEVSHEGPKVGERSALVDTFDLGPDKEFALAVFTSVGCRACRALAPAVDALATEPWLAVRRFEEDADSEVWEALAIPGAPYAIAFEPAGRVMAKGTFNNLAQLESIVATAARRRDEHRRAEEAVGV